MRRKRRGARSKHHNHITVEMSALLHKGAESFSACKAAANRAIGDMSALVPLLHHWTCHLAARCSLQVRMQADIVTEV